jgi:hypothetical protein
MKVRPMAIALFVVAAGLLWLPFDSYTTLYDTRPGGAVAAGEIGPGFSIVQQVRPPERPAIADTGARHCFAIDFATYARRNNGYLRVTWLQGDRRQQWRVAAWRLQDNAYRHFCPDAAFSAYRPYRIEVRGVDGKPGDSATVWLVADTRLGIAQVSPANLPQGRSMALQGSHRTHVVAAGIARVDRGAFLFGWLCTLAIGIIALVSAFPAAAPRVRKSSFAVKD